MSILGRRCPRAVVVALCAALVLAPTAAVAATWTQLRVAGASGTTAAVTPGGELATTPINPGVLRAFHFYNLFPGTCERVYTAPAHVSFVLTSLTVNVFIPGVAGPGVNVRISTSPDCADIEVAQLTDANPGRVGASSFSYEPGIVVPAGHHLYAVADNGSAADVYGFGYVVPVTEAPAPTVGRPGAAQLGPEGPLP